MLSGEAFLQLWQALDEEEDARIQQIRSDGRPAREALLVLWRRFHPNDPPPIPRHLHGGSEPDSANSSLISGMRFAIDRLTGPFTTQDVTKFLDRFVPELRASERRVSVSSYLSRLASNGLLTVLQRQENGLANTYVKSDRWEAPDAPPNAAVTSNALRVRAFMSERE